jgi:hypothetical protein
MPRNAHANHPILTDFSLVDLKLAPPQRQSLQLSVKIE